MAYWACAQLETHRERLALYTLGLAGFSVYFPQLRQRRMRLGRKVEVTVPLFPGYAFVEVILQWHAARWAPGVLRLVMTGKLTRPLPSSRLERLRRARLAADALGARVDALLRECEFDRMIEQTDRLLRRDRMGAGLRFRTQWNALQRRRS